MNTLVFYEPTDRRKAVKALQSDYRPTISTPNLLELKSMVNFVKPDINVDTANINEIVQLCKIATQYINVLVLTMGVKGVIVAQSYCVHDTHNFSAHFYSVDRLSEIKNVSGAGDCFASGFIVGMLNGYKESYCVSLGLHTAKCALRSNSTVPAGIKLSEIQEINYKLIS